MSEWACPHRKYGTVYDTYATIKSLWVVELFGKLRYLRLFGFLKECDRCKKKMIRWPWWEPPINAALIRTPNHEP